MQEFLKVSYTLAPLLLGLAFHGLCIKFGWLGFLGRPIDAGFKVRGRPLFGANKTYRGVIAVALGTAAGVVLQLLLHRAGVAHETELLSYANASVIGIGAALGAAAMLAELPNSALKRQLGIAPGKTTRGWANAIFYVLDQVDMLVGVWIVLGIAVGATILRVVWSVVFLFIAHQLLTLIGYQLGMRATAR